VDGKLIAAIRPTGGGWGGMRFAFLPYFLQVIGDIADHQALCCAGRVDPCRHLHDKIKAYMAEGD